MLESLVRAVLACVALAIFVVIALFEQNFVFLFAGLIFAWLFLRLGRRRRRHRGNGDDSGGWFDDWFDGGGGDGGNGGGGNGGGGGGD